MVARAGGVWCIGEGAGVASPLLVVVPRRVGPEPSPTSECLVARGMCRNPPPVAASECTRFSPEAAGAWRTRMTLAVAAPEGNGSFSSTMTCRLRTGAAFRVGRTVAWASVHRGAGGAPPSARRVGQRKWSE